jgi:predicted transcriptional regulator
MLVALGDGRSRPAGRLAAVAEVSASTASSHLRKLVAGGLLVVENAGRRRNYRLAGPEVAVLIEALERLAPALPVRSLGQSQQARAWRQARVCYDHVAGVLGVELMRSLLEQGHLGPVRPPAGADPGPARYSVTSAGAAFLETLGLAIPAGREPVRYHRDSTEDGSHISGRLGRALLTGFTDLGWLQRHDNRRLRITPPGRAGFGQQFGISLDG